jgi:Spy/CpxP family protein refolding chaperone
MTSALRAGLAIIAIFALGPGSAAAEQASPYAGQEQRAVKALSAEDVRGLLEGAGLGYAKAAELNGWPGPLHALELRDALSLTEAQVQRMEALRREMKAEAVPLGRQLIEAERALDTLFASGSPSAQDVMAATARIGEIEGRLRAVHLVAHVRAAPVLTRHQTMLYGRARGYSDPQGHGGHSHGG